MTLIQVNIDPRKFIALVLENICGDPDMVTDRIIQSIQRWLDAGNNKESFEAKDIDILVDWVMTCK